MKLLVTGACGFVGSTLIRTMLSLAASLEIWGIDNFSRQGSRDNIEALSKLGVRVIEGDTRRPSDLACVPRVDWVIDCAAEPSVLAGVSGNVTAFDVLDSNLVGTIRQLEFCRDIGAGFIFLSTSRVYSIRALADLRVEAVGNAFQPMIDATTPGLSSLGINESFSTDPPVSLYGVSKRASELVALEYAEAFKVPVWINRCGVLAGGGQFGKHDQGIVSYWIQSWRSGQPLAYIGFGGHGWQVRDCLHPRDLAGVVLRQCRGDSPSLTDDQVDPRISNFSGGIAQAFSLAQLSEWCADRFGPRAITSDSRQRPYDLPWVVLDHARATERWNWSPATTPSEVFEEIARQRAS